MTTTPMSAATPRRNARLARISLVQQITGACEFTAASPVIMPTRSRPKVAQRSKNFSETNALIGAV